MLPAALARLTLGRKIVHSGHQPKVLPHVRALGLLVAVVLVSTGCSSREEIVYVDSPEGHGSYTPIGRSDHARVHTDGHHEPAADVQVGPGESGHPYTPFAGSSEPLVHADGDAHVPETVALAHERRSASSDSGPSSVSAASAHGSTPTSSAASTRASEPKPVAATGLGADAKPGAAAAVRPAASPTPPARLALGAGLGAQPGAPVLDAPLTMEEDNDRVGQVTVSGKIESIVGSTVRLQTSTGAHEMQLAKSARVERDALGSAADLKPGQFVGVAHVPSGPADSVRLYARGASMPLPGIAPVVGSRSGQVTTFGSVVSLQFGGLLLNTGSQTTTVSLPSGVPILRPAPQGSSALDVGAQVIATGPIDDDGAFVATAVRVIGEARPAVVTPEARTAANNGGEARPGR